MIKINIITCLAQYNRNKFKNFLSLIYSTGQKSLSSSNFTKSIDKMKIFYCIETDSTLESLTQYRVTMTFNSIRDSFVHTMDKFYSQFG